MDWIHSRPCHNQRIVIGNWELPKKIFRKRYVRVTKGINRRQMPFTSPTLSLSTSKVVV